MPITSIVKIFIALLFFLVIFYLNFMGSDNLLDAILQIFSRTFTGSIQPAYHYLEIFPNNEDFLFGRSFPNPMGIMPFEHYKLAEEVMNWKFTNLSELGIVGSMPTVFWAEAYANFGISGVFIVPFLLGIIVWIASYSVNKFENTPFKVGLLVWLIIHFKGLSITGFSGYIFDFYLIFVIIFVIVSISLANYLKIKFYKKA
jgi:hypothetical protein